MVIHAIARCCWCRQPLVQVDGAWWCPTRVCAKRQADYGLRVKVKGQWRWLYVPTPKQVEFDACTAKYRLYGGSAGPGKSHAARFRLYRKCLRIPGYEALLLRRTFPELEKTHLRRMASEVPQLGGEFLESKRLAKFPHANGRVSLIECGHMDDDAAVSKYLSSEYDDITPDEGSTYAPQPLLELSTRARTSKPEVLAEGGATFSIVSNPGGPSAPLLLDLFIDHQPNFEDYPALEGIYDPKDWAYLGATLDDNPYLDPAYERQLAVLPKWRYEQLRHGDWRVFSGQFFSEWQERMHVAAFEPSPDLRWFRSLDWGRNQPGCVLWWAMLPDHRLYIRRDWKFAGMDEQEVAAGVKRIDTELGLTTVSYTAADPSIFNKTGATHTQVGFIGQSIGETLRFYGVNVVKSDNDRFNGWGRCHALLRPALDGRPWQQVHPECRYLIRSIAGAVSDPKNPDDVNTETDDHALDTWRFGAMSRPHPMTRHASFRFAEGTMGALRYAASRAFQGLGRESVA